MAAPAPAQGTGPREDMLVFDGMPQADPFSGWVSFPAYATDRIGLIRVTRGGGSGYRGPGARIASPNG